MLPYRPISYLIFLIQKTGKSGHFNLYPNTLLYQKIEDGFFLNLLLPPTNPFSEEGRRNDSIFDSQVWYFFGMDNFSEFTQ